jgi:TonB-linked SusC/RagA family outer membrane protein
MQIKALCNSPFHARRQRRECVTKTLLVMKLTGIILLAGFLQVSARGSAQTITYQGEAVPLTQVFSILEKQTGYVFFYNSRDLEGAKPVTVNLRNAPLENALKAILDGQPLRFVIKGNTILITRPQTPLLQAVDSLPRKTITARGVILAEAGQPLAGANVSDKQTGHGTITNAKGEYQLSNVPVGSLLMITFVGYTEQDVKIKDETVLQIFMKVAKNELDKVVVQAYGTTTERFNTGNISTVGAEEIEKHPLMNPLEALQGQVPGLVITQSGGGAYASAPLKVEIRGRSVINPNLASEPLYIVDGVPLTVIDYGNNGNYASGSVGFAQNGFAGPAGGQSPLFSINPEDIESISVLKDADATAIYGSRGANGVILITTKKGKPGPTKIEGNVYQGESEVTKHYDLLNTSQYLQMRREAFQNDNIVPDPGSAYDLLLWDTTRNTDWQKALWGGMGKTTDVNIAMTGGDKQTSFRVSGTYHRQTDILTISGSDQRTSIEMNLNHKSPNQRLSINFSGIYSYSVSDLLAVPSAVLLPPDAPPIFDASHNLNFAGWGSPNSDATNDFVFGSMLQPYTGKTGFLNGKIGVEYIITKGLTFSVNVGYSTYHSAQTQFFPIGSQDTRVHPTGSALFGDNDGVNNIEEPILEYKRIIGKGTLNVVAGGTLQDASSSGNYMSATGYANDNLLGSVANATRVFVSNGSGDYKYAALYARANYNWDNKYIINLSGRRDGSSRFGPNKEYGNFGSIGAAWIFSEESWMKKNLQFISYGKLRGSYGTTGSDQIGNYLYLSQWSANGNAPYQSGGAVAYTPGLLSNPNLVWQSNHKLEGAIAVGLFHDLFNLEVSRYVNRCGNQLVPFTLPVITGFNNITANFPAVVQNSGWEGFLHAKIINEKQISAVLNFNIGINRNKLASYPDIAQSPYASSLVVGQTLNLKHILHYLGVDPQTGEYVYEDKNHDGMITSFYNKGVNDLYPKDLSVKFDGGFGGDFRYHTVQLSVLFIFRKQTLRNELYSAGFPGTVGNQSTAVLNHWQKPGDIALFARYTTGGDATDNNFTASDGAYTDGSYIRLRNLSLTYDVPGNLHKNRAATSFRIYVRGENLLLFTKYNGVDPDAPGLGLLPPQRVLTGGVQFSF